MQVFHIIEETTDQQVIEIHAPSASEAIAIYLANGTHEHWDSIERLPGNRLLWNFPSEYCTMCAKTEHLIFAKWTHKKGLY
jgi:hypothetical protein